MPCRAAPCHAMPCLRPAVISKRPCAAACERGGCRSGGYHCRHAPPRVPSLPDLPSAHPYMHRPHPSPPPADASISDFYGDKRVKLLFKLNLCQLANRVSTRSGAKYKDSPAIFAWDLISEPRRAAWDRTVLLGSRRWCEGSSIDAANASGRRTGHARPRCTAPSMRPAQVPRLPRRQPECGADWLGGGDVGIYALHRSEPPGGCGGLGPGGRAGLACVACRAMHAALCCGMPCHAPFRAAAAATCHMPFGGPRPAMTCPAVAAPCPAAQPVNPSTRQQRLLRMCPAGWGGHGRLLW